MTYKCCHDFKECFKGKNLDPDCKVVCCDCEDGMEDERTEKENAEICEVTERGE